MNYKRETRIGDRQAVKIALYGILLSLAMLLGYVETLVPISLGIPGVKLGLANLVNIVSLYLIPFLCATFWEAVLLSLMME